MSISITSLHFCPFLSFFCNISLFTDSKTCLEHFKFLKVIFVFFLQLFDCHKANIGTLMRKQPHSSVVDLRAYLTRPESHWESCNKVGPKAQSYALMGLASGTH